MLNSFTNLTTYWKDDFQPLQDAGKDVLAALRDDENAPDADLFRRISAADGGCHQYFAAADTLQSNASSSAANAALTPGIPNPGPTTALVPVLGSSGNPLAATPTSNHPAQAQPPTVTLHHERSELLPALMAQQLQNVKTASLMGLLPEAELAWMTVDDTLFVWPCGDAGRDGATFCSFTVPNGQCVLSVGLVPPKKGVFRPSVKWCLVVNTADEATILCLADSNDNNTNGNNDGYWDHCGGGNALMHRNGALRLVPTLFNVPTDNVRMLSVCGTADGRIFLGGEDGCLYEMTYEIPSNSPAGIYQASRRKTVAQQLDRFYDHGENIPATIKDENRKTLNSWALANGKRALSAILPGRSNMGHRPRKCRKLNHSKQTPALASALLPEFLTKATSFVLGAGKSSASGGSIVKMVVCEERSCIYTLGSKGWICAFSLKTKDQNVSAKLLAVMNTPETARLYLDAVARQRMVPPTSLSPSLGNIAFGSSAPRGVGGMDGARQILSLAKLGDSAEKNVLAPISLHLVPQKESAKITLVAVTRGGLRYYISSLSSNALNSGPSRSSGSLALTAGKLSLCHIRAPPPLAASERSEDMSIAMECDTGGFAMGGFVPKLAKNGKLPRVDASFCGGGATVLAVQTKTQQARSSVSAMQDKVGDQVIALSSDFVLRKSIKTAGGTFELKPPGGLSETLSLPLGQSASPEDSAPTLPGGIVSDIAELSKSDSNVLKLALHSRTPTDTELSVGLVPEFVPGESRSSRNSKKSQQAAQSRELVLSRNVGLSSSALMVAMNVIPALILSRPLRNSVPFQNTILGTNQESQGVMQRFRISTRHGVRGFSMSSADVPFNKKHGSSQLKSPRLNPWLLQPAVAPLNQLSIQHLLPETQVVVMNSGGLHYFQFTSVLRGFEATLRAAGENVETDESVTRFFRGYGYAEGFAMCAILASGVGRGGSSATNNDLKLLAERAALYRMNKSSLVNVVTGDVGFIPESGSDLLLPNGYSFSPSSLLRGINKVVARLLRPVWHKPLVVVTEGRSVVLEWNFAERLTPAKVEFLLDSVTLSEILNDINAMAELMKRWFSETIESVPGSLMKQSHMMDIEEHSTLPMTEAQSRQSQLWQSANTSQLLDKEKERIARLTEQRKLHSLFRLVSRSHQLLRLFSLLVKAHGTRGLPEVEWGYLHGLTVSQLVLSRDAQERLEKMLNQLVLGVTQEQWVPSNDADILARDLSQTCYLYFSPGSYYGYLGLSWSRRALEYPLGSARRTELTSQAAKHFYDASKHWHSSALVCGHSLHTKEQEGYAAVVRTALAGGSPVAKAAAVLSHLGEVEALVEVCLQTAKNFRSLDSESRIVIDSDRRLKRTLAWEADLYHKRPEGANSNGSSTPKSPSRALVLGKNVNAKDAITTCWSLIFYHVMTALQNPETQRLALQMISKCSSERDKSFLHELFGVLVEGGHSSSLIRVQSPALEEWLSSVDRSLLFSYYSNFRRFDLAGNIASQEGMDNSKRSHLKDRLENLTRAIGAYESAVKILQQNRTQSFNRLNQDVHEMEQKKRDAEDWHDMGMLQLRVLDELSEQSNEFSEKEELSYSLMDASALFGVAGAHGLYSICLLLISSCRSTEYHIINPTWRKVFCSAIFQISTSNKDVHEWLTRYHSEYSTDPLVDLVTGTSGSGVALFEEGKWAQVLEQKIISLGKEVFSGGAGTEYFPVPWILSELEDLRLKYTEIALEGAVRLDAGWSLHIACDVGVPYDAVLGAWENLHMNAQKRNTLRLSSPGEGVHLDMFRGIVILLERWCNLAGQDQNVKDQLQKAVNSEHLLSRVGGWKHQLERFRVADLLDSLEAIENAIRAILLQPY